MENEAPFRVRHRGCQCHEIPRELLFEWVGPDQEDDGAETVKYEIPRYFEAHVALDYLDILYGRGSDAAFRWAMIFAIGAEGWKAMRSPGMPTETFDAIAQVILDRIRGKDGRGPKDSS